jgi:uncharacterized spore protein YtfJ
LLDFMPFPRKEQRSNGIGEIGGGAGSGVSISPSPSGVEL